MNSLKVRIDEGITVGACRASIAPNAVERVNHECPCFCPQANTHYDFSFALIHRYSCKAHGLFRRGGRELFTLFCITTYQNTTPVTFHHVLAVPRTPLFTPLSAMAAAELDVPLLSNYCSLPQQSIDTLVNTPTAELVRSFLQNVATRAREHNELVSEDCRLKVELESAVRKVENKDRTQKISIEKAGKEAAELKQKLQAEGRYSIILALDPAKTRMQKPQKHPWNQSLRV